MPWMRFPLLRSFLLCALGFVAAEYRWPLPPSAFAYALLALWLSLFLARSRLSAYFWPLAFGTLWHLSLFWASAQWYYYHQPRAEGGEEPVFQRFIIRSEAQHSARSLRFEAETEAGERVLLSLAKDSAALRLRYGEAFFAQASLRPPAAPRNPDEFDYRRYLERQGLARQAYLPAGSWQRDTGFTLGLSWAPVLGLRQKALGLLREWALDPPALAVAEALFLGYRQDLASEQKEQFAKVGLMHLLAVSGLHLGIVYLMLSRSLFFLQHRAWSRLLRLGILLLALWFYALLTGLSPSVVRAATMFSFVALGQHFKRRVSIYNTLLASAFLLMLCHPAYLFSVGFQLSYAAVFGIVWMQPSLSAWWFPRNRLLRFFWDLITVSIAAQCFTLPLALFYFHQFPPYFLLSNLLGIPLVMGIMYYGFPFFLADALGLAPEAWLWPLAQLFDLLLASVAFLDKLPYASWQGFHLRWGEVFLLYGFIILLHSWWQRGGLWTLRGALSLGLILALAQGQEAYWQSTWRLQTFQLRSGPLLTLSAGAQSLHLYPPDMPPDSLDWQRSTLNFGARDNWQQSLLATPLSLPQSDWVLAQAEKPLWYFGGQRFYHYRAEWGAQAAEFWWVTEGSLPPEEAPPSPARIIAQSLSAAETAAWQSYAQRAGCEFYHAEAQAFAQRWR